MTVRMVTSINRAVGLSTDIKSIDVPQGSLFEESDTGKTFEFDGQKWFLRYESDSHERVNLESILQELLLESKKTNENMEILISSVEN